MRRCWVKLYVVTLVTTLSGVRRSPDETKSVLFLAAEDEMLGLLHIFLCFCVT